jgi:prepilin-type N-terminal cleavage/methylation domain-containing protein
MNRETRNGFTIVELLIVIVVIAILAAVTIIAYNGIQTRSASALLQADLRGAAQQLEKKKIESNDQNYPANLTAAALQGSDKVTYQYTYIAATNSYCLTATSAYEAVGAMHIESSEFGVIKEGGCSDHSTGGPPVFTTLTWTLLPDTAGMIDGGGSVEMSGDGNTIVICSNYVYRSTDRGATWVNTGQAKKGAYNMDSCGMSRDGQVIIAGHYSGAVSLSTDGGDTWRSITSRSQRYVGVSGDGQVLAAFDRYGAYLSNDAGTTWVQQTGITDVTDLRFVSLSYTGDTIISGGDSSVGVWCSANGGSTWVRRITANYIFTDAAISDDGTVAYVTNRSTASNGRVYKTTDSCGSFTSETPGANYLFSSIATSGDGSKVIAAKAATPNVSTSKDSGATWAVNSTVSSGLTYEDVSSNIDGSVVGLLVEDVGLYIGTYGP